ncbi:MarR family transcriptional regulator [Chachezhania sediminis]|uniref:MarR family transcriptional regulator n=1 Tax=Chachezhania sediminis TaxID=2599291 RepID=UPI00389902DE
MGPIRGMLADADVTEQQWRVLRVLDEGGAMEPTAIADQACLLLPSLTRILQKLEEKALIVRQAHPSDKRRQVVEITRSGQKLIDRNLSSSQQLADAVRTHLGQDRYELLLDILGDLNTLHAAPEAGKDTG